MADAEHTERLMQMLVQAISCYKRMRGGATGHALPQLTEASGRDTALPLNLLLRLQPWGENSCLQSFTLEADYTQLDDQAGVALAAALGKNSCLQSFMLGAWRTQLGDQVRR